MNPQNRDSTNDMYNSIDGVAGNEQKLYEVHKHPFGIIMLYIEAGVGLAVALGLMYFLVPQFTTDDSGQLHTTLLLASAVAVVLTLFMLLLASIVYRQNYLIVSDKNITQVLQQGLFKRKVSELSMANIEDVTAEQRGLLATLFNYGKLTVETAGEQNNFIFNYCPKPNYCGKMVLDARQRYIETDPNQAMRENNRLNLPPAPTYQVPQTPSPPSQMSPQPPEQTPTNPTTPPPSNPAA